MKKAELAFTDRVKGSLIGAAIGAELGLARQLRTKEFANLTPAELEKMALAPAEDWKPERGRAWPAKSTALIDVGVQAYLAASGRATPEHFGPTFRDHAGISFPSRFWDGLHTIQEVLKEGMNPRVSGMLACPAGFLCAAMPAVGIYHFAHPDYAYLDGVELASVAQPRIGADWAGLCAALIASAFQPQADGATLAEAVLKVAFQYNRDLFYKLDWPVRRAGRQTDADFIADWLAGRYHPEESTQNVWIGFNPAWFALPVLRRFADQPELAMRLLLVPDFVAGAGVWPVIGGAALGAMHGPAAFPATWRKWAEPIAKPWLPLEKVVRARVQRETIMVKETEKLARPNKDGRSQLHDKVSGCILAGAIGNAMGSPVEGKFYQEIDEKYPRHVLTVLDPARLESEDDNQMAMLLVETYLGREGAPVMARDFGRSWTEKLNRDHFYIWCMGHAYDRIREGWDPRIVGHWSVVTGSTVMCMEPVGVYHAGDPEFAAIDATAVSYMYQRGLDVTAAAMLAATVAEAFRPGATVDSVCQAALDVAPRDKFRTFDKRTFKSCHHYLATCLEIADKYDDVFAVRRELYDRCLLYDMIDPLELWGYALAMLKIANGDVRLAAIGGTNIGRDSDTIAGRAAMLAGILSGAKNVPREWVEMFPQRALDRITRNADRLTDLIAVRKLGLLRNRLSIAG